MTYKTLMLQLYRPGARKRALMDAAMLSYARALQWLLDLYRPAVERMAADGGRYTKTSLLRLVEKDALRELNAFAVQPFKDSIKMEFAGLCAAYLAQSQSGRKVRFPCVYAAPGREEALLDALATDPQPGPNKLDDFEKAYRNACARIEKCHPLYFGRYDVNRDFCLLYDEYTGRFYAKLYLLNAKNAILPEGRRFELRLRYVTKDQTPLPPPPQGGERYLILPLSFGKKQLADLNCALENPGVLHTARLLRRDGGYYLMLNMECGAARAIRPACTMGIARRAGGGLHYTLCRKNGEIMQAGSLLSQDAPCQRLFVLARDALAIARRHKAQVVLESDGGMRDNVAGNGAGAGLRPTEYRSFSRIMSYKLPEAGLPGPVFVSPKGLYNTCPQCHFSTQRNRVSGRLFACIECGFASPGELVGSLNLARRLNKYKADRVPVYCRGTPTGTLYYNKTLGFELLLPAGSTDATPVYYQLDLLARGAVGYENDTKKYAMLQKLRAAREIRDAVRIVRQGEPR